MGEFIQIDGNITEGGGQIIRIATSLSVLLNKPIQINNIRAGRSKPGLASQHLKGLQLARDLCSGKLIGDFIGSTSITFIPSKIKPFSHLKVNVGTAGSVVLLLQVSLPILMFTTAPSTLELIGGTNADFAPQIDYLINIFQSIASRFGMKFNCDIIKRGFFPKGGGIIKVESFPVNEPLKPIELVDRGVINQVIANGFIAGTIKEEEIMIMETTCKKLLKDFNPIVNIIKEPSSRAVGTGSGILLKASTSNDCIIGSSGLGRRGTTSINVIEEAVNNLMNQLNKDKRCLDEHLQDQVIILMALANGTSRVRTGPLTLHTETAIEIIELIIGKKLFKVIEDVNDGNIIECNGIGLNPSNLN